MAHPIKDIKYTLKWAAEKLTSNKKTIKIDIQDAEADNLIAILNFEMFPQAQYKVVDDIFRAIKLETWEFYEDITVEFSNIKPRLTKKNM